MLVGEINDPLSDVVGDDYLSVNRHGSLASQTMCDLLELLLRFLDEPIRCSTVLNRRRIGIRYPDVERHHWYGLDDTNQGDVSPAAARQRKGWGENVGRDH